MSDAAPPPHRHDDHPEIITRNARYGLLLFAVYLMIYGGFVVLSAFAPTLMARPVLAGVNLAVVYGFVLIGLAFVLALVYMFICRTERGNSGGNG